MRAPVSRSAATARYGVGSSSKFSTAATGIVCSRSVCVRRWPWIRPRGTRKLPPWMPSGKRTRNSRSSCLRRKLSVCARGTVAERGIPVNAAHHRVDLVRRHARGIETADHGAHAGARDGVDRDAQLLERLQHADMREPARAAAGQHEPDARPRGRRAAASWSAAAAAAGARKQQANWREKTEHRGAHRVERNGSTGAEGAPLARAPIMNRMNATARTHRYLALAASMLALPASAATLEEVIVTATRSPVALASYPGSATRIAADVSELVGATHSVGARQSRRGSDDPARQRPGIAHGAALAGA